MIGLIKMIRPLLTEDQILALLYGTVKQNPWGCQCGCGECELSYDITPRSTIDFWQMLGETDDGHIN